MSLTTISNLIKLRDLIESNIHSLKGLAKSISAFSSYEMHAQREYTKDKTLQKSRKYPKLQFKFGETLSIGG